MQAIRVHEAGGPEVMQLEELPEPEPGPGEVAVEVAAAGVNFVDLYHRSGAYSLPLPTGLGVEGAGTVRAVGDGVTLRAVGDRVGWIQSFGSYAESVTVAADQTVAVPDGVDDATAAAVLLQGVTAHFLANSTHALQADDTALVYAAAGGVGRLLVQLAKRRGARVLACTSTPEKAVQVRELGADEVIMYREIDVVDAVRDLTGGDGVDVVYDGVGADTFDASLRCLRPRGLMVLYGQASGRVPPVDLQELNRLGSLFVTRPGIGAYVATHDELEWRASTVLDLVRNGQLDVHVHDRYPLADAARAHTELGGGQTTGKLILVP